MAKRKYQVPVLLTGGFNPYNPGDESDDGDGTGQSGELPFPCTFEDWQVLFAEDMDEDGFITEDDYYLWMKYMGFDTESTISNP